MTTTSRLEHHAGTRLTRRRQRLTRLGRGVTLLYPLGLLLISIAHAVAPQRGGIPALTQIFAPYLFLPLLALIPLALSRSARLLRLAVSACVIVAVIQFAPAMIPARAQPAPGATRITALTWNVYARNMRAEDLRAALLTSDADVIALQEFTSLHHAAIEADSTITGRYPWRVVAPGWTDGMAILSRVPISEHGRVDPPIGRAFPLLWARIEPGDKSLLVFNTHAISGRIRFLKDLPLPIDFDPSMRDAAITHLRSVIDPLLDRGERVLLLGDFNATEREPAYRELRARLTDAHRVVGWGSGHSWRPSRLKHRAFGIIRIDYVFGSAGLIPLRARTDCAPSGSDHCRVEATLELR